MSAARPLQNRVDPYGALAAVAARGALMGNRGGRIHRADQTLGRRRWASRQWISCRCAFRGRRRQVWGDSYSELFFLDEPTALAAGHRPCFECRRADALAFRRAVSPDRILTAAEIDLALHRERLAHLAGRFEERPLGQLPDGAMVEIGGRPYALRGETLLPWGFFGYGEVERRSGRERQAVRLLTPASSLAALAAGYRPLWADEIDGGR
ncbi:MAG: hypothetical protein E7774_02685 [Bradyrhizobium sp.]|nr:MAG: hypothetical protein E7774_02685 [Bradyrhizobium sp.]